LGASAVANIILLWVLIIATLVSFWRVRPLAGILLIPYLLWVSFAAVLNCAVWQLNPQSHSVQTANRLAWQLGQKSVALLGDLEKRLSLSSGRLRFEIMVEMPQIIVDASGWYPLPALIDAGEGRISGAHFGTYDYTAGCGITAANQKMQHEACQYALRTMQVALAGDWGVDVGRLYNSPTCCSASAGTSCREYGGGVARLAPALRRRASFLANGFYQGWDLHPAQLPTRYAALFAFFLEGLESAGARLRNFIERAAQATLVGDVFDDAATGQGLLNYFLRAVDSGAITAGEAAARSSLTLEELQGKSFVKILRTRTAR
jgi:hypothetical protein